VSIALLPRRSLTMATTNGSAQEAFTPILQAVNSMRDGHREEKKAAHEYLEKFQKSVGLLIDP